MDDGKVLYEKQGYGSYPVIRSIEEIYADRLAKMSREKQQEFIDHIRERNNDEMRMRGY
jgi:hypothetical protein